MANGLLEGYDPPASRYDEMRESSSTPRAHWRGFLEHLDAMPPEALRVRSQFVHDAIASDGVTYNVYADPQGASRPWELDLLPLILPGSEWREIAAAVAQRARLLDA